MNSKACPLCSGERLESPYHFRHSRYWFCPRCRSFQRLPGLSENIQSRDYQSVYGEKDKIRQAARTRSILWPEVLGFLEASHPSGECSLLDVGCGYGDFLAAAREKGWSVLGIEINPTMRDACREKGIDVWGTSIEETDLPTQEFDCVTYLNVLDSITDPVQQLKKVSSWMKPGGKVLIRVPNALVHGFLLEHLGRVPLLADRYFNLEVTPLNAWLFHPDGLRAALENIGFRDVAVHPARAVSGGPFTRGLFGVCGLLGRSLRCRVPLTSSVFVTAEWTGSGSSFQ